MRLKTIIIENFRGYLNETRIPIEAGLTAFIGKNDVGKSTILEALDIFFGNSKIETDDACKYGDATCVTIGCVFADFPQDDILDGPGPETLKQEFLLNSDGDLEIHKVFDCTKSRVTEKTFFVSKHPTADSMDDLLSLNLSGLRKRYEDLGLEGVDKRLKTAIRRAIWGSISENDLQLDTVSIPTEKETGKEIWDRVSKLLPIYALFKSDRPSKDSDDEIQDPMKLAVSEALRAVETDLDRIKQQVQTKATEVAKQTLEKLEEMNSDLAHELIPHFSSDLKWANLFKLSLTSDDEIPINKRGSGVRRLILLNFFRAAAERKAAENSNIRVIYAIEEPETSQHPSNQEMLINALLELSKSPNYQVLITTHVPGLAGLLPLNSLRFLTFINHHPRLQLGDEHVFEQIAKDLGVFPEIINKDIVKVIICVEGSHDIEFLKHISAILHKHDPSFPDLNDEMGVVLIPLGGDNLKNWVTKHYLKPLKLPEVHIYDNDKREQYQSAHDEVNSRGDGSWATFTRGPEMENYLHLDAINEVFTGLNIQESDLKKYKYDIPKLIKSRSSSIRKKTLKGKIHKENDAKNYLNNDVVKRMTIKRLSQSDPHDDIIGWMRGIAELIKK